MPSSTCGFEQWIPAPESWPALACRQCEAAMRVPFAPRDGLCGECRGLAASAPGDGRATAKPLDQRLLEAGAPRKFSLCTRQRWESRHGRWQDRDELRALAGWPHQADEDSWLLFITRTGVDDLKTDLATAVLGEALDQQAPAALGQQAPAALGQQAPAASCARARRHGRQPIRWASQAAWLREIKASWNAHAARNTTDAATPEHIVWRRVAEARVLLFDEFGGLGGGLQFEKPWWRSQVSQLIHHRECHRLPTIVTARFADWREVQKIDESLLTRMNVALKISLS